MTQRFRLKFTFWLNVNKSDEQKLAEIIEDLKAQRGFASAIRDGLRIVWELRQGKTDTLYRLFPLTQPQQQDTSELAALVEQFKQAMVNTHSAGVAQATMWNMPPDNKPEVRMVENEEEHKQLSVKNTLAAIADF